MKRSGFTLIELLVSVTILVTLVAITLTGLNVATAPSPKQEAISLASYIEGARARAIHSGEKYGVRLHLDPYGPVNSAGNPITATSASYITDAKIQLVASIVDDPTTPLVDYRKLVLWSTGDDKAPGVIGVDDDMANGVDDLGELGFQGTDDEYYGSDISAALDSGSLDARGVAMTITMNGQQFRYVAEYRSGDWYLNKDWYGTAIKNRTDAPITAVASFLSTATEQAERQLSRGVCVDLETSRVANRIPSDWYDTATESYSNHLDIMFEPSGEVATTINGAFSMGLVVGFTSDVEGTVRGPVFYNMASRPNREFERIVFISRNGSVGSSEINFADTNSNNVPDDPFFYAETGR